MMRGGPFPGNQHAAPSAVLAHELEDAAGGQREKTDLLADGAVVCRRPLPGCRPRPSSLSSTTPSFPCSSSNRVPASQHPESYSLLRKAVDEWTRKTGKQPDAAVRIEGCCFRLHKKHLASSSAFLRRHLQVAASLNIPPPSPASPDTFAATALFCYGSEVLVTVSNVAALRVAAEWLQMSDNGNTSADRDDDYDGCSSCDGDTDSAVREASHGLLELTEGCFSEAVANATTDDAGSQATVLLQSCLALIPRAPAVAAGLAGRCMEAMEAAGRGPELGLLLRDVVPGNFLDVAGSIAARNCGCHDVLYGVVDRYLQARGADRADDDKSRLCTPISCALLTRPRLLHLVQNPRMPLRFVVQAILAESYNTRRSLLPPQPLPIAHAVARTPKLAPALTLGCILEREAAARQQAGLRAAAKATSFRIYELERDIAAMRRKLRDVSIQGPAAANDDPGTAERSQSCRFLRELARPANDDDWGDYFDEEGAPVATCSGMFAYEVASDSFGDGSARFAVPLKRRSSVGSAVLRRLKSIFRAAVWAGVGTKGSGAGSGKRWGIVGCRGEGDVVSVGELRRNVKTFLA